MHVQPYLFFDGRCEEAIKFYQTALGAEVLMLMRFKESPEKPPPDQVAPNSDDKIMHASLRIGDTEIMASDGYGAGTPEFKGITLSLSVQDVTEADRLFKALAAGGKVQMPIGRTFFSPRFGMVADKFGVSWMVMVPQAT
jgi:PhnB protein